MSMRTYDGAATFNEALEQVLKGSTALSLLTCCMVSSSLPRFA